VATRSRAKIALFVALALAALGAAGLVVAVLVGLSLIEPAVRSYVVRQAEQRGIVLELGELDYSLRSVRLRNARFSLVGVGGIRGHVQSADIDLQDFEPVGIDARGVDVQLEGPAATLAVELAEWTKNYPQTYELRVVARDVSLGWRPVPGSAPWAKLSAATVIPSAAGGVFMAKQATVAGVELGEVGAAWSKTEANIALGLGVADVGRAPVRVSVDYTLASPSADITLQPTDLNQLGGPLGVRLPVQNVTARGTAHLVLPGIGQKGPISGNVQLELEGYVPPHPVELSGFVFGNVTKFDTQLSVSEDRKLVTLTDSRVQAGAFVLKGKGSISRHPDHAQIQLGLRGDLPCGALADAAAQTRLGRALGGAVGSLAKLALKGSVAVLVRIEADTRDLAAAKLVKTIGVGCGLRPLDPDAVQAIGDLLDLVDLPLPARGIPALPSALPSLPSALRPPRWPLPGLGARQPDAGR
jgi:hypothetical protein